MAFLKKSLYGTRDAVQIPQREVQRFMGASGFKVGKYNVCTYFNERRNLKVMVHGDDFVTVGSRTEAKWFDAKLKEIFEVKTVVIGT